MLDEVTDLVLSYASELITKPLRRVCLLGGRKVSFPLDPRDVTLIWATRLRATDRRRRAEFQSTVIASCIAMYTCPTVPLFIRSRRDIGHTVFISLQVPLTAICGDDIRSRDQIAAPLAPSTPEPVLALDH
jgi:hypothetical protein